MASEKFKSVWDAVAGTPHDAASLRALDVEFQYVFGVKLRRAILTDVDESKCGTAWCPHFTGKSLS